MHTSGHRTQTHLVQTREKNLFEYLHTAGYHIHWFGKNDVLAQDGFGQYIDNWWEVSEAAAFRAGASAAACACVCVCLCVFVCVCVCVPLSLSLTNPPFPAVRTTMWTRE